MVFSFSSRLTSLTRKVSHIGWIRGVVAGVTSRKETFGRESAVLSDRPGGAQSIGSGGIKMVCRTANQRDLPGE